MSGPLAGLRVIDLTTVMYGPYCTQLMGDYGADVVKVEPPGGDISRQVGPGRNRGMAAGILTKARNKRSLVLDLKGRVGGVVTEPRPPQTRACATDALGSSPDRFAQGVLP